MFTLCQVGYNFVFGWAPNKEEGPSHAWAQLRDGDRRRVSQQDGPKVTLVWPNKGPQHRETSLLKSDQVSESERQTRGERVICRLTRSKIRTSIPLTQSPIGLNSPKTTDWTALLCRFLHIPLHPPLILLLCPCLLTYLQTYPYYVFSNSIKN